VKKIPVVYAIPLGIALVMAALVFFDVTSVIEHRVYDAFLGWRPDPVQDPDIVLVEVDDQAVSAVGTWPISRSITAESLLLLKEMGARFAVFDIEYVNKSPRGVNASVLEESFPAQLVERIGSLADNNAEITQALKTKRFPLSEATSLADDFRRATEARAQELVAALQKIAIDNDQELAQSALVFGGAFLTVNVQTYPDASIDPALKKKAVDRFALRGVPGAALLRDHPEISPVIDPILSSAQGIGFTNVSIDGDGVRRRIDLLKRYGDVLFPQLAFAPFLEMVGHPGLEIRPDSLVLRGAKYPDGKIYDVTIPRAQDGSVLINWPHSLFKDSFRRLSFYYLHTHDQLWKNLLQNLKARSGWGYLDQYQGATALVDEAAAVDQLRQDLLDGEAPPEAIADLRAARDGLLASLGEFLASKPDENLAGQLRDVLAERGLAADQRKEYETIQKDLPDWFAKTRSIYDSLMRYRTEAKGLGGLTGAICFLGNTPRVGHEHAPPKGLRE